MEAMRKAGFLPRDYAFCGLIAAYSQSGDWRAALHVHQRIVAAGGTPSVHVYNALITACERSGQYEKGLEFSRAMHRKGVAPTGRQHFLRCM
jgi:pentatricopeptide repeat protein